MEIDINGVKITLTKDQLKEIAKQTKKCPSVEDIDSYEDAVSILSERTNPNRTVAEEIETIIRAANFLDNGNKIWKADFTKPGLSKWIPYFERKSSGWVLIYVYGYYCHSLCSAGLYYKEKSTGEIIVNKFIKKYNQYLG